MTIQELINKLTKELDLPISRPKLYHYDRKGVFGQIGRGEWGDRQFTNDDYYKVKISLLLSELKFSTKQIQAYLKDYTNSDTIRKMVQDKGRIVKMLLKELV